jgi:hypothetical protein
MKVYEKLFLRSRQHPVSKKEKFSAGIADYFASITSPESDKIAQAIERLL